MKKSNQNLTKRNGGHISTVKKQKVRILREYAQNYAYFHLKLENEKVIIDC